MPSTLNTCGILALGLLGVTNAHMIMKSPVPFDVANINNSPLAADGSDFPCKVNPEVSAYSYDITAMNEMPVDKPILLSFDGSAIHGGGACQLSITFDEKPTKESVFKVIQTFEGGECPKPTGPGLTFNIPKEFPNAEKATLAWTWFNRIGNREMYMNCAPISITGGSDSKDYYESLPDMFVANIATTKCGALEGGDVEVPDPGQFVLLGPTVKLMPPVNCPAKMSANNTKSGTATNFAALSPPATDYNKIVPVAGGGGGSSGASPPVPAVGGGGNDGQYTPQATAPAQPSSTAATPNNGQYSQPPAEAAPSSPSSAADSAPAPTASAPAASSYSTFQTMTIPASSAAQSSAAPPAYPTLSPSIGQGVSGPSSGGATASPTGYSSPSDSSNDAAGNSTTTCTTEGAIVCNGSDQFGLCDHGSVVWQKVASGTTCSNGSVQRRSAHVRRHAHGAFKVRSS